MTSYRKVSRMSAEVSNDKHVFLDTHSRSDADGIRTDL